MLGFVAVFAHPYHAVTRDDGTFAIENVPPGTHTLHVWHEGFTPGAPDANGRPTFGPAIERDANVTVTERSVASIDFVLSRTSIEARPHATP